MKKAVLSIIAGFIITACGLLIAKTVDVSLNWLNTSFPPDGGVHFAATSCVLLASTGFYWVFLRDRPGH